MSTPQDPSGLEREISARQAHLAATVDELTSRVAPKALASSGLAAAQAKVRDAVLDEHGHLRTERVAAVGGAVAAVVTLVTVLAVRRRRS